MNLENYLSIRKTELGIAILGFLCIVIIVVSSRTGRLTSENALKFEAETELILEERIDLEALIDTLESEQVNFDKEEMQWAARLLGWRSFQTGRYTFTDGYSYNALLSKMARGIQDPVSVTILPGITPDRLSEQVASSFGFSKEEFTEALQDSIFLAERNLTEQDLFGRMLPETYLMYWTASAEDVRNKILREFNRNITRAFEEELSSQDLSVDDALIMASIVEWEATDTEEKPVISGLYWNRLNRGMLLQADPTVNYAVGERRRLLFEDYQVQHPFNTYINPGLPPGPITNPSLSTIRAAINPVDHDYLYMVASPDGGHVFTETFEQHKIESEKWRRWLREQYRIKRQREAEEASGQETP